MWENKKGNILKGKVLSLKIILSMLLILTAGFCFAINSVSENIVKEKKLVSTAVFLKHEGSQREFSALFTGDVIFSVEKVGVNSESAEKASTGLVDRGDGDNIHTFLGSEENYVFQDLPSDGKDKTVIDNGDFVKFENLYNGGQYNIYGNTSLQEAIIVSFGSYVYDGVTVDIAKNGVAPNNEGAIHAGITLLDITIKKNGENLAIPSVRNISTSVGPFLDFVCMIKQDGNNEGKYEINIKYMAKNQENTASFEFNLVNNTSYTQSTNSTFGYNAKPTLGWTNSSNFEQTSSTFNNYYIGKTGSGTNDVSFPTITYDYTKFKLSYVHTANRKNTTHTLTASTKNNLAEIVWEYSGNETGKKTYDMIDYDSSSSINLVTIMFTQPGTYVFTYEYLYDGRVVSDFGFEKGEIKLAIFGMSACYSKTNYEGAKLQYFNIATKTNNNLDLIIPDGYEVRENTSSKQNQKLGFVYSLVESENREGNVLKTNTINSMVNDYIGEFNDSTDVNTILDKISYAETNQGSIWIEGNDVYTDKSFYYYSTSKINDISSLTKEDFVNTTSFNKKGYYLVFVKVSPSGSTDSGENYWQVFAFRYTSSSVDINVDSIKEGGKLETVAGGKFTNNEVQISWKKPGIFDRNIVGYYYSSANQDLSKEQLLLTSKTRLSTTEQEIANQDYFVAKLGSLTQVPNESFVKYLISVESEGESATYKTFTVDRQSISGIQAYLVQEANSGNSIYYTYATDPNGFIIPINSAVTDGLATLNWNNKLSGAEIIAEYSYTPFSSTSATPQTINGNNSKEWVLTNYELGTTIEGSSLQQSSSIYNVDSDCILFNQGIYIVKLQDTAGNICYYSLVIDRTQNYFIVNGSPPLSNTSKIFGDDVQYNVGDYKAFKLDLNGANATLSSFIQKASSSTLNSFDKYYSGTNNNINAISKLFQKRDSSYYLTIANKKVVAYETDNSIDSSISGIKGQIVYSVKGQSYLKKTLYVIGENNTFVNTISANHPSYNYYVKENTYVTITINKDNARGTVYYSDKEMKNIPTEETADIKILDAGSDTADGTSGMVGARATSVKNVAFVWNMGTGNFEVSNVEYKYYALTETQWKGGNLYFYGATPDTISVYNNGKWGANAKKLDDGSGRAVVQFNGANDSKPGLYVVTRTYKSSEGLGEDDQTKNYYFIIDRNGIVEELVGNNIKINMLIDDEASFNDFSTHNPDYDFFGNVEDGIENERYNIYLTTTKLPATLSVPAGKYFAGADKTSAGYFAGELNVAVYFNDVENQLKNKTNRTVKIYDSQVGATIENGYFVIDIYQYLTRVDPILRDRLAKSGEGEKTWLFLPGDYIVRITDNVKNASGGTHQFIFAFKIDPTSDRGPQAEILTGFANDETMNEVDLVSKGIVNNDHFEYHGTVSQEYLKVNLPKYIETETKYAQVDQNYLIVKQYQGENAVVEDYINHPYEPKNGVTLTENSKKVTLNADGSISIWLNTLLKDGETIIRENINKPLKYTITIRYKIGDDGDKTKYEDCYIYYTSDDRLIKYYETTYTIVIDRVAPSANIENLNKNDALVEDYNKKFEQDEMFESDYHKTSSNIYFTKQYAKYYDNKTNKGYIYAYQVEENTDFKQDDIVKVYFKHIGSVNSLVDLKSYNLTLPFIDTSSYTEVELYNEINTYGKLGLEPPEGVSDNMYYEIIEIDAAGNTTQYVIHYCPTSDDTEGVSEIIIPTKVTTTTGDINIEHNIVYDYETELEETENGKKNNGILNIYNIVQNGAVTHPYENYFKIEVLRVGEKEPLFTELTTTTTDFEKLTQDIVSAIENEKIGNFYLTITTRREQSAIQINLYDDENVKIINIERMIDTSNGYKIDLSKAVEPDGKLIYFATEIVVKYSNGEDVVNDVYVGKINQGGDVEYFKNSSDLPTTSPINCEDETTYQIIMTDVLGNVSSYRFNTSGREFSTLTFENSTGYYNSSDGVWYGFANATFKYDTTIYTVQTFVKDLSGTFKSQNYETETEGSYKSFNINAIYDRVTGKGGIVEVRIDLYASDEGEFDQLETRYFVTIDTRLSNVVLRDATLGVQQNIIKPFPNVNYNDETVQVNSVGSGNMNLLWNFIEENSYFNYTYKLYEQMNDNSYVEKDLTNKTEAIYGIQTSSNSKGVYRFVITVYGKNDTNQVNPLGNRVFAFEVKSVSTNIYEVRYDGEAIFANSTFKLSEHTSISTKFTDINTDINLPLYVTNKDFDVVVTMQNVVMDEDVVVKRADYKFTIIEFKKENAYTIYIGILKITPTHNLVNGVYVPTPSGDELVTNQTSFTVYGEKTQTMKISLSTESTNDIFRMLNKNTLFIDTYYMGKFVESQEYFDENKDDNNYEIEGNYEIRGNGEYSFKIRDLAGNIHEFTQDEDGKNIETIDYINLYIMREVVVLINGEAPVDNAFYNGNVQLVVYQSMKYETGSISITAERNGVSYAPTGYNPYVFSGYGTYRVTISATYKGQTLDKIVTFTILNEKEARQSIDLTNLKANKITKVLNPSGQDITSAFNNILINRTNSVGYNLSYQDIMENAKDLNVTSGKITFALTYLVEDGIYPAREITMNFTLNNEIPKIQSTLETGEKTTKGFEIFFNPSIIYEQIGEAYVYINDEIVAYITENSSNEEMRISTTFKANGDGDYYIRLVSSSGIVLDSYKVTIKEPLNAGAIIVIIVVTAVVLTVTITIIVLRRKMRIR